MRAGCPKSRAVGLARLARHRFALMADGCATVVRDPNAQVQGPLRSGAVRHPGARPLRGCRARPLCEGEPAGAARRRIAGPRAGLYRARAWRSRIPSSGLGTWKASFAPRGSPNCLKPIMRRFPLGLISGGRRRQPGRARSNGFRRKKRERNHNRRSARCREPARAGAGMAPKASGWRSCRRWARCMPATCRWSKKAAGAPSASSRRSSSIRTQFAPTEDFWKYPRDVRYRHSEARRRRCDACFAPGVEDMYPAGFSTVVTLEGPAKVDLRIISVRRISLASRPSSPSCSTRRRRIVRSSARRISSSSRSSRAWRALDIPPNRRRGDRARGGWPRDVFA